MAQDLTGDLPVLIPASCVLRAPLSRLSLGVGLTAERVLAGGEPCGSGSGRGRPSAHVCPRRQSCALPALRLPRARHAGAVLALGRELVVCAPASVGAPGCA